MYIDNIEYEKSTDYHTTEMTFSCIFQKNVLAGQSNRQASCLRSALHLQAEEGGSGQPKYCFEIHVHQRTVTALQYSLDFLYFLITVCSLFQSYIFT